MSEQVSYFRLGFFVLICLALIVAGTITLGAGAWMRHTLPAETYILGSVHGLQVGSPVEYLGVDIGKVSRIGFICEKYDLQNVEQRVKFGRYVLIEMELDPDKLQLAGKQSRLALLDEQVKAGLRLRLQSNITGPTFIEAQYVDPATHPPPTIAWKPRIAYIPSAPGTMTQLAGAVDRLAAQLEKAPVVPLIDNGNRLMVDMDKAVNDLQVARVREEVVGLLGELRQTNGRVKSLLENPALDKTIADVSETASSLRGTVTGSQKDIQAFVADLPGIAEHLKASSRQIDGILSGKEMERILAGLAQASDNAGPAVAELFKAIHRVDGLLASQQRDIEALFENLRRITENMAAFSEDARNNPSRVLLGTPPPRITPGVEK